jgi:ribosomal-protein-alanine N-acetyltransferase
MHIIFRTSRLSILKPTTSDADVELFYSLWTDPEVMVNVGFPNGLDITRDEIRAGIAAHDDTEFDKKLIVQLAKTGEYIGECKLGLPKEDGISETDVKMFQQHWGKGYGTEIKKGLVAYLFEHTDAKGVRGTPKKHNIASQRMQLSAGAVLFKEHDDHYEYIVWRSPAF